MKLLNKDSGKSNYYLIYTFKSMKKQVVMSILAFFSMTVSYGFTVDKITYSIYDEMYAMVSGYDKKVVNVVIPSEVSYNGKTYQV